MYYILWFFAFLLIVLSFIGMMNTYLSPFAKIAILILMYILGGIILTYLDFYYLGLTYIIVYVGAIAIIFIFVIMMLDASISLINNKYLILQLLSSLLILQLFSKNSIFIYFENNWYKLLNHQNDVLILSRI
jgi:NADH-quinone oxidoreductase subunit J